MIVSRARNIQGSGDAATVLLCLLMGHKREHIFILTSAAEGAAKSSPGRTGAFETRATGNEQ